MTDYYEAPDGHGEPTIWVKGEFHDMPLIHRCEVGPTDWPDVVARMTGATAQQLETATIQLKTMSGVVDKLRADMRTWQRAAAERTRERDEATDQLEAMTRACGAYRADRDELSELLAKANDGTSITTDDATVRLVAAAIYDHEWDGNGPSDDDRVSLYVSTARAILAALTGVPSEPVDTHRHYFIDVSTFTAADAGRHNWLCECGATKETRDRA